MPMGEWRCAICGEMSTISGHACGGTPTFHPQTCGTCGDVLTTTTCDGCFRRDYEGMRSFQEKFIKADIELRETRLQNSDIKAENERLQIELVKTQDRWAEEVDASLRLNGELLNLLRECHGFLSHSFACPESPDKFSDQVVDLAGRVNAVLTPEVKRKDERGE